MVPGPRFVVAAVFAILIVSVSDALASSDLCENAGPLPAVQVEAAPGPVTLSGDTTWLYQWDFEGGPGDTLGFSSYDFHTTRESVDSLYWHATTFRAISGRSMWCGGYNDRSGSWEVTAGGYGNYWEQIIQVETGPFSVANGCSVRFDARYVIDCQDGDAVYFEYYSFVDGAWKAVDRFCGRSGCVVMLGICLLDWNNYDLKNHCLSPSAGAAVSYPGDWRGGDWAPRDYPGYPYAGDFVIIPGDSISGTPGSTPIKLRWRFMTDFLLSSQDGDDLVKGFWLDNVQVRADAQTVIDEDFDAVPEGGIPGPPWSFPSMESIYDGWAVRYDLNPPYEEASWQWSMVDNGDIIPPPGPSLELPGYSMMLHTPGVPTVADTMVVAYDYYVTTPDSTCDFVSWMVQLHHASGIGPWAGAGVWGPWVNMTGGLLYEPDPRDTLRTRVLDLTAWSSTAGADSIRVGWMAQDMGLWGSRDCWNPSLPPHAGTQWVIDNVRIGCVGCQLAQTPPEMGGRTVLNFGPAVPNPFSLLTEIGYRVPPEESPGRLSLAIYDPAGRLVRQLVDGYREAGVYSTIWDATDQQGNQVASGVYFYRFTWKGVSETRRLVLVR